MPTKLKFLYWWKLAWVKIGWKRIDFEWESLRMGEFESGRIGEVAFLKNQNLFLKNCFVEAKGLQKK